METDFKVTPTLEGRPFGPLSDAPAQPLGVASPGTSEDGARADHVHPGDPAAGAVSYATLVKYGVGI